MRKLRHSEVKSLAQSHRVNSKATKPPFPPNPTSSVEKGMATHSSIPAWRILWTEETGAVHRAEETGAVHRAAKSRT